MTAKARLIEAYERSRKWELSSRRTEYATREPRVAV